MKKLLWIIVLGLLLSSNVYSKTIVVKANPEKGFHFPYLLKTSKKTVDANYIVVESNNTGGHNKSIKGMTSKAKKSLGWVLGSSISKKLNYPVEKDFIKNCYSFLYCLFHWLAVTHLTLTILSPN